MEKHVWKAHIKEGAQEEYIRRHDEIWPEMKEALKAAGISNYTIWLSGNELFGYYECEDSYEKTQKAQNDSEVVARWEEHMKDILVFDQDPKTNAPIEYRQVFYLE